MKKKLIAGAASVALAAMPVVGVFAAAPVTQPNVVDNLQLTVNESCTFSTGAQALNLSDTINAGAQTTWAAGDPTPTPSSHAFVVKCNSKAYTVTATATDLTNSGAVAHGVISYVANANYDEDVQNIGDDGEWTAVLTGGNTGAAISTTSSTIKSGNATTTDNFSVAYKAYAGNAQNQGTYSGTVTYTLTGSNS